jgi:MFS family permease
VNSPPGTYAHLSGGALTAIIVFYAVLILFFGWLYVRIIRRAGYSGWWVLMALVPIGNIIMLCLFAFKEWPIHRELDYLRRHASMTGLPGYGSPPQQYGYGLGGQPPGYGGPGPQPGDWQRPESEPGGPRPDDPQVPGPSAP